MRLSPCGRTLAVVPQERKGHLELRDVDSGRLLASRRVDGRAVMDLAFSPDGRWLATGGWKVLRTWHPRSAAPGMVTPEGTLPVYRVAFGAGVLLALDSHLRVWDLEGRPLASIPANPDSQAPLSISRTAGWRCPGATTRAEP